jgi:hypothetical protein
MWDYHFYQCSKYYLKHYTLYNKIVYTIVYTCKPHINHKYYQVIITPSIFSSKMLYFGWWELSWQTWLNLYDMETRHYFTLENCAKKLTSDEPFILIHEYTRKYSRKYVNLSTSCQSTHAHQYVSVRHSWSGKRALVFD